MATKKKAKKAAAVKQTTVLVNGQVVGSVPSNQTIATVLASISSQHGLRTFSVKVNGKKIATPDANKTLAGVKTIELYAKDARG